MSAPASLVLDAEHHRMVVPEVGEWTVKAVHHRLGGDVDVILGWRSTGRRELRFHGFRRDSGEWIQLAGTWSSAPAAEHAACRATRRQVFVNRYVIPLLDVAADLADSPTPGEVP